MGWALVAPSLALFALVYLYPVAYSAWVSLYEWDLTTPARYVGLQNYRALWSAEFGEVVPTPLCVLGRRRRPVPGASDWSWPSLLNNRTRLGALFQASIFSSYVVSWVAVSLLWIWLLDPQYGLVAYLLRLVGLPAVNWLGDHRIALWSLVLVTVWKTVGYPLVIYLAGLQAIPGDLLRGGGARRRGRLAALPPHHLAAPHAHHPVPPRSPSPSRASRASTSSGS